MVVETLVILILVVVETLVILEILVILVVVVVVEVSCHSVCVLLTSLNRSIMAKAISYLWGKSWYGEHTE